MSAPRQAAVEQMVASVLLDEYSERLSCNGCNDTEAERFRLPEHHWQRFCLHLTEFMQQDDPEWEHTNCPPDWAVADYLAAWMLLVEVGR